MDAKELRIGNWVKYIGGEAIVENGEAIMDIDDGLDRVEPIPLTEGWLVRFGFSGPFFDAGKYYLLNGHCVYIFDDFFEFEFAPNRDSRFNLFCKYQYVHQLQNLYFALTGEELTIK